MDCSFFLRNSDTFPIKKNILNLNYKDGRQKKKGGNKNPMTYQELEQLGDFLKKEDFHKNAPVDIANKFSQSLDTPMSFQSLIEAYGYIERQQKNGFPIKGDQKG